MNGKTLLLWAAGIIVALNVWNFARGTHILQQKEETQDDADRKQREQEAAKNAKAMPEK